MTHSHGRIQLLLAFHNHQPDGNFDEVFAQAYADCYARILDALDEAPHVRVSLHHTGALLEWIAQKRPDYLLRMAAMVRRGQVEVLGGGFYEPMLAVLPERDARGQIHMMSDFCERHFGARPEGMWLAERVWEPGLPALLAPAGVRFTLLDDNHFRSAGMGGPLRGYYATDKAGAAIAIFPIDQKLRQRIPFSKPEEAMQTLRDLHAETGGGDVVITYGDDGEKFGLWPGTMDWVWNKGWLRTFFRMLGEARDWIETTHFAEVLRATPPSGRVYLPTASYEEMGEWALPAPAQLRYREVRKELDDRHALEAASPYLRGGIWQGFLARYREANFMHKKMVAVSDKVAAAAAAHPERTGEIVQMHNELYRAQCNCSYWHGLFGGLYLNYLRDTVYRHLLVAEAFADAQLERPAPAWAPGPRGAGGAVAIAVEERDVDADLLPEILVQTSALDVTVRPHEGGAVQELAYRPKTFMLTNVLGRHEEAYHQKLRDHLARLARGERPERPDDEVRVKEPDLERHLVYDRYARYCFVDHFLPADADLESFARGEHRELGDFVGAGYRRLPGGAAGEIPLARDGQVDGRPVALRKTIRVANDTLTVDYSVALTGGEPVEILFAPELSLTLLAGNAPDRGYRLPDRDLGPDERVLTSRGALADVPALALVDEFNRFRVDLDFGAARPTLWRFPLETVSMSEAGFERIYQGSVIVPLFRLRLGAEAARVTVTVRVSDL